MANKERVLNKEELERLYWRNGLSTHKIAMLFSINPQMVRYLALKYGIKLRPPKSIQKKKYNVSKKLLENLYLKQKLPMTKVAEKLGIKAHSTVVLKLLQCSIPLRTMSEVKTKYPRIPFSTDQNEKAYMIGLRAGDVSCFKSFHRVIVSTSTTHPAQVDMIKDVFEKYSHVNAFIHKDKRGIKEFHVQCGLHHSFDFLLNKPNEIPNWILNNDNIFYYFLAGYSDCETNWDISKKDKNSIKIEFNLRTNDMTISEQIHSKLISEGFNSKFGVYVKKGKKATYGTYTKDMYFVRLYRKQDTIRLAKIILPLSQHKEKIGRMKLICSLKEDSGWNDIEHKVLNLRREIKESRLN